MPTPSDYAAGVPAAGNPDGSLQLLSDEACSLTHVELQGEYATEKQLTRDINEAQRVISQTRDWVFELFEDDSSIVLIQGENTYALSLLTVPPKYPLNYQGLVRIKIGNFPLDYIEPDDMDDLYKFCDSDFLASPINAGDTSIVLTNSDSFPDTGTFDCGGNIAITYMANDKTTGTLSGIPASGTGAITASAPAGRSVFVGMPQAFPKRYTIYNGNLITDVPVSQMAAGINLKVKYLRRLPQLTSFPDLTLVPFYHAIPYYLAYKIETRKRNYDDAGAFLQQFMGHVGAAVAMYKMPMTDDYSYYNLSNLTQTDITGRENNEILP